MNSNSFIRLSRKLGLRTTKSRLSWYVSCRCNAAWLLYEEIAGYNIVPRSCPKCGLKNLEVILFETILERIYRPRLLKIRTWFGEWKDTGQVKVISITQY